MAGKEQYKTDRNERLLKFWEEHKGSWTQKSVAKLFKISEARVNQIIRRAEKRKVLAEAKQ